MGLHLLTSSWNTSYLGWEQEIKRINQEMYPIEAGRYSPKILVGILEDGLKEGGSESW